MLSSLLRPIRRPHFTRAFAAKTRRNFDFSKQYYEVLGVEEEATPIQIRKAYFNLAKQYHPDLNVHKSEKDQALSQSKFQEVGEAYELLMDENMKKQYDRHLRGEDEDFLKDEENAEKRKHRKSKEEVEEDFKRR